jgi:acetyl esterase/lipase
MSSPPEPHVMEDCRGVLQVLSDGTVRRSDAEPAFPVHVQDGDDGGVEWKDVVYDPDHGLGARLYRPRATSAASARVPVVAYFHGGGFCIGSCRWHVFHSWCLRLAAGLPAVVASFDYRLPAAQEDGAGALAWLRGRAGDDPWLAAAADLSRVFVAGDSAGGNVAHHAAVKSGELGLSLRGGVLLMPAMAGEARTRSELECPPDAFLTAELADRYLRLALPEGATRDHPAVNLVGPEAPPLPAVAMPPLLVVAAGRDVLRDRNAQYAAQMREWGKDVEFAEVAGEQHVFFLLNARSESADDLVRLVRRFVVQHMDA